jgi:tRNA (cmo5U34)-methyltransferase
MEDTNAAIWRSGEVVQHFVAEMQVQEQKRAGARRLMARLLPFGLADEFTFLDLGAGTGAASRALLEHYPHSTAILADFSAEMMGAGERELAPFAGRYRYVEADLTGGPWPTAIPSAVDAIVTSMSVHHLTDERKRDLFGQIFAHLRPGGWYLNYDPVSAPDPVVAATWERVADLEDPDAKARREHRTAEQHARWENHVRYISPLDRQLEYLRLAGFHGIDVYWKRLENVIYGGWRPNEEPDGAAPPR